MIRFYHSLQCIFNTSFFYNILLLYAVLHSEDAHRHALIQRYAIKLLRFLTLYTSMFYLCTGKSMKNKGGISFIWTKRAISYKAGDVICFKGKNNKNYAHRITQIDDIKFTTKGDNLVHSKPYEIDVSVQRIQSKVTWKWP